MLLVIGSKYSGFPAGLFNDKTNKQNGVAGHLGLISALNLKMCYLSSWCLVIYIKKIPLCFIVGKHGIDNEKRISSVDGYKIQ